MKTMRCVDCVAEFTEEEVGDSPVCPACGTAAIPMWIKWDLNVPINWHELRILANWAANWAETLEDRHRVTLHRILKRLSAHRPEGAPAITLVAEVKELQKHFPSTALFMNGEMVVPPKEPTDEAGDSEPG